jgi:hypothetical protein
MPRIQFGRTRRLHQRTNKLHPTKGVDHLICEWQYDADAPPMPEVSRRTWATVGGLIAVREGSKASKQSKVHSRERKNWHASAKIWATVCFCRLPCDDAGWLRSHVRQRLHSPSPNTGHINDVVIIFQENRSTDNLFHNPVLMNRGADIATQGLTSTGQMVALTPVSLLPDNLPP